jgi:hypothetical protein
MLAGAMVRMSVILPNVLRVRLDALAEQRGISRSALIREILEGFAKENRPLPLSVGMGDSGRSDISALASDGLPGTPDWRT